MAMWKPKLVVRRGRRGGIASPVTTTGYVFFGLIGVALSASVLLVGLTRDPWALIGLLVSWWPIRDAVAWFVATEADRAAFHAEVSGLESTGVAASPSRRVAGEGSPAKMVFYFAAGAVAVVVGWNFHPAFLVLGMFLLAFGAGSALDVLRAPRKH
jgi:hypothetical protein